MSNFKMDDYVPVNERIEAFYAKHPDGSIQSEIVELTPDRVTVKAYAYRSAEDTRPGIGHSSLEIPGSTPFTRGSEIENAETSAWGRAIAALGFEVKRGLASAEEVRNKQPERSRGGSPSSPRGSAPVRTPEEQALLDELLALPGMTHARMSLLADAAHVEKGTRATAAQLREMLRIAQTPLPQPGQPEIAHSGSSPAPAEDTVQSEGMPVSAGSDGTEGEADSFGSASPADTPDQESPSAPPATAPPVASPPPVGSAPSDAPGITADTDELASYPPSDEEILAAAGPGAEIVPPELQERIAKARAKGKRDALAVSDG